MFVSVRFRPCRGLQSWGTGEREGALEYHTVSSHAGAQPDSQPRVGKRGMCPHSCVIFSHFLQFFLIFFLNLFLRVGGWPIREGPGYAAAVMAKSATNGYSL